MGLRLANQSTLVIPLLKSTVLPILTVVRRLGAPAYTARVFSLATYGAQHPHCLTGRVALAPPGRQGRKCEAGFVGVMACHNAARPPSSNCSPLPVVYFKNPCFAIRAELSVSLFFGFLDLCARLYGHLKVVGHFLLSYVLTVCVCAAWCPAPCLHSLVFLPPSHPFSIGVVFGCSTALARNPAFLIHL